MMDANKNFLITNANKTFDNYNQLSWDEFISAATNANTPFSTEPGQLIYVDTACLPSEDMAAQLNEAFSEGLNWISFDESKVPEWFQYPLSTLPGDLNSEALNDDQARNLASTMDFFDQTPQEQEESEKIGRIVTFGSAKGGSGKTFTSIITATYYAKEHPEEKVCLLDLDVEEPQVALVVKQLVPNMKKFYTSFQTGDKSFDAMKQCVVHGHNMPKNLDFYLTPRDTNPILDDDFWNTVMTNLFYNYDMIFLDTGTTYMQTAPIIKAYKVADKICLVTMASLASSIAVQQQIQRLTGEIANQVYTPEDELGPKINLIVTNSYPDTITKSIIQKMGECAPIIACFGNLHAEINRIQILGEWNYFDDNEGFREGIRGIYA